jgi:uncharacterized protein YndB with AHSA1/START domain
MTLAKLTHPDGRNQLRFTRTLAHPPEKVWRAITETDHLRAWFPQEIRGGWDVGAALRFVEGGDESGAFDGEVLAYDPPKLLAFTWGTDELRFELAPQDGGCVLTLIDTFDELGKAGIVAAGWDACLDALEADLDGMPIPDAGERWIAWHDQYLAAFPAEATAIGPPEGHDPRAKRR